MKKTSGVCWVLLLFLVLVGVKLVNFVGLENKNIFVYAEIDNPFDPIDPFDPLNPPVVGGDDDYGGDDYGGDDYGGDDYGSDECVERRKTCNTECPAIPSDCCKWDLPCLNIAFRPRFSYVNKIFAAPGDGDDPCCLCATGCTWDSCGCAVARDQSCCADNTIKPTSTPNPTLAPPPPIDGSNPTPTPVPIGYWLCDENLEMCPRITFSSIEECERYTDNGIMKWKQGPRGNLCYPYGEDCIYDCSGSNIGLTPTPGYDVTFCRDMYPTEVPFPTPSIDPSDPTPTPRITAVPTPLPDPFMPIAKCFSRGYIGEPSCLIDGTCWEEGESLCDVKCGEFYVCNRSEGQCFRKSYTSLFVCQAYESMRGEQCFLPSQYDVCQTQCSSPAGSPPTLPEDPIDISNDSDLIVIPPDSDGRNHVCQVDNKNKVVLFYVTVLTDAGSDGDNISTVGLRFDIGGTNNLTVLGTNLGSDSRNAFVASGVGMARADVDLMSWQVTENARTIVFKVDFNDGFPDDLSTLQVSAIDIYGNTLPATDTGRKFRYWDCKIDYIGELFDDSGNPVDRQVCSVSGYDTLISNDLNFNTLEFINTDDTMPALKINGSSFTQTVGKELLWGSSYTAKFNTDFFAESPLNRTIDLNVGTTLCHNSPGDVLDLGASSGGSFPAFPYALNPAIKVDFSWLGYSEAWFQIVGGGIQAGGDVTNIMPGSEKMSVSNDELGTDNDSWVIAEGSIVKGTSNAFSIRNWNIENGRNLINTSFGYTYFDNEYRIKKSKGEVVAGWDNIKNQTEGVFFVNGSLNIGSSNTVPNGNYLVVVVKDNLTISQEVEKLEGIFIVDGNVSITGENIDNNQLVINGMIYAGGSVTMTRSYANHKLNNTLPATIIYFRPDLIFNLPGDLSKTVSGWREGR